MKEKTLKTDKKKQKIESKQATSQIVRLTCWQVSKQANKQATRSKDAVFILQLDAEKRINCFYFSIHSIVV